jgi:hypothetical protein
MQPTKAQLKAMNKYVDGYPGREVASDRDGGKVRWEFYEDSGQVFGWWYPHEGNDVVASDGQRLETALNETDAVRILIGDLGYQAG